MNNTFYQSVLRGNYIFASYSIKIVFDTIAEMVVKKENTTQARVFHAGKIRDYIHKTLGDAVMIEVLGDITNDYRENLPITISLNIDFDTLENDSYQQLRLMCTQSG